jgi:hypothetical protein
MAALLAQVIGERAVSPLDVVDEPAPPVRRDARVLLTEPDQRARVGAAPDLATFCVLTDPHRIGAEACVRRAGAVAPDRPGIERRLLAAVDLPEGKP